MEYKVYLDELDVRVRESIEWLLQDNIDGLEVFEGLEIDDKYDDEEGYNEY